MAENDNKSEDFCVVEEGGKDGEVISDIVDCDAMSASSSPTAAISPKPETDNELSVETALDEKVSNPFSFRGGVSATSNSSETSAAEPTDSAAEPTQSAKCKTKEEQPSSYYAIVSGCPWPSCLTNALFCVMPKGPDGDGNREASHQIPQEPGVMASRQGHMLHDDDSIPDLNHLALESRLSAEAPSAPMRCVNAIHKTWGNCTNALRFRLTNAVVAVACRSGRHPYATIALVTILSIAVLVIGFFTNFDLNLDTQMTFTPTYSRLHEYWNWEQLTHQQRIAMSQGTYGRRALKELEAKVGPAAENATGSAENGRILTMILHADGDDVFHVEGVDRLFQVLDAMRAVPDYDSECGKGSYVDQYGHETCEIWAFSRFFNHNKTVFEMTVKTDDDLFDVADAKYYPDGGYVDIPSVLGKPTKDESGRPVAGKAFFIWVFLSGSEQLDRDVVDALLKLHNDWKNDRNNPYNIEFTAAFSYSAEIMRAVLQDVPLIPVVFILMCLFTCLFFFRWDRVHSRTALGFGSVWTIVMSTMTGYGIMFLTGVPMTSMTNLLIFIVVGIALDDTFVITGAYFRTADLDDINERLEVTMESCGLSITMTTLTTLAAFALGCTSSIPAIKWLCLYAIPTLGIDFIYQITFFIALLVLDERRIQQNRRDCCCCVVLPSAKGGKGADDCKDSDDDKDEVRTRLETDGPTDGPITDDAGDNPYGYETHEPTRNFHEILSDHVADRFMRWYAEKLMIPWVKVVVLVLFLCLTAGCTYSATKMRQQFDYKELLPKDSYVASYVVQMQEYSNRAIGPMIKFRYVDQSDPEIQQQMLDYIEEIKSLSAFGEEPPVCWIQQYRQFIANNDTLKDFTFEQQLAMLMSDPRIRDMYVKTILMDPQGKVVESSCKIFVNHIDWDSVKDQTEILRSQRAVSARQPVNQGRKTYAFYTYDLFYFIWEFYNTAVPELISSTISSMISVLVLSFVLVPHWSAVPILFPLLSVLFVDMIGMLQMFGYYINVITYVSLVLSIGLLIDFNLHILLRYYESVFLTREEKVKDALGTMGASILVGGLSTFLSVVPLVFSTSAVFATICLAMLSLVFLGLTHGLILLPVLLSYFGTEKCIQHRRRLTLLPATEEVEAFQRALRSPESSANVDHISH